jgi:hypothetical protein
MLEGEVLILKLISIDGLSSSAIVVGEISALAHEVGDDTVESASLITKSLLSCAQSTEVFCCLRDNIGAKLKQTTTKLLFFFFFFLFIFYYWYLLYVLLSPRI